MDLLIQLHLFSLRWRSSSTGRYEIADVQSARLTCFDPFGNNDGSARPIENRWIVSKGTVRPFSSHYFLFQTPAGQLPTRLSGNICKTPIWRHI